MSKYPRVIITEEAPREGMQIESVDITLDQKLALIDALAQTGLTRIVVGSFVSPKWTPQMKDIDQLLQRLRPRPGVTYLALALNDRGRERMRQYSPPLTIDASTPETHQHLCDIFIKRNTNRTMAQQAATWPTVIERARARGVTQAGIGLSAPWGSNFRGEFPQERRLEELRRQHDAWAAAGIPVVQVKLADPMGWNTPHRVATDLVAIKERWPAVRRFVLHLHNQRGLALTSIYAALQVLGPEDTLSVDTTIGGIGGCPYCGNGRVAGMAPTEDLVSLLEEMGIPTGVDILALVEAVALATRIIGRPLYGQVSKAGPFPRGPHLYPASLPVIETVEQAEHFRLGPEVYAGQPRPWEDSSPTAPIPQPSGAPA
jgi:hydroxymethylglutaryl-CoA lyase